MEGLTLGHPAARGSARVTSPIEERVREAYDSRTPLRIVGRSHWLGAGRPVLAGETLSLADCSGVVDYVPGDLTITVRGGTTLTELARVTRHEGQWFPVAPFGSDDGTIGATVATASSGPLSHGFGTIRDLVLGVEIVTGEARIVRGGGRVVKNVAGFDLVRLMTGSWGTLGVITEVSLRLYALPAHRVTVAVDAPAEKRKLEELCASLLSAPVLPFALELVNADMAHRLGLPRRQTILADIGGNAASVATQRDALGKLGGVDEIPMEIWDNVRTAEGADSFALRVSGLPSGLAERWESASRVIEPGNGALMHASISRGTVRCVLPTTTRVETLERLGAPKPNDTVVFESLPAHLWTTLSPTATADRVSQGRKRAFDPLAILNPGILGPLS